MGYSESNVTTDIVGSGVTIFKPVVRPAIFKKSHYDILSVLKYQREETCLNLIKFRESVVAWWKIRTWSCEAVVSY